MRLHLALLAVQLRPYAKAVTPAAVTVAAVILHALSTGSLDAAQLEIALVGLAAASVTWWVKNAPTGWARYAKGIAPAVLTLIGLAVHLAVTGEWSATDWRVAATGLIAAAIATAVPNASALMPFLPGEDPDELAVARAQSAEADPPRLPGKPRGER